MPTKKRLPLTRRQELPTPPHKMRTIRLQRQALRRMRQIPQRRTQAIKQPPPIPPQERRTLRHKMQTARQAPPILLQPAQRPPQNGQTPQRSRRRKSSGQQKALLPATVCTSAERQTRAKPFPACIMLWDLWQAWEQTQKPRRTTLTTSSRGMRAAAAAVIGTQTETLL